MFDFQNPYAENYEANESEQTFDETDEQFRRHIKENMMNIKKNKRAIPNDAFRSQTTPKYHKPDKQFYDNSEIISNKYLKSLFSIHMVINENNQQPETNNGYLFVFSDEKISCVSIRACLKKKRCTNMV